MLPLLPFDEEFALSATLLPEPSKQDVWRFGDCIGEPGADPDDCGGPAEEPDVLHWDLRGGGAFVLSALAGSAVCWELREAVVIVLPDWADVGA